MLPEIANERYFLWLGSLLYAIGFLVAYLSLQPRRRALHTIFIVLLIGGFVMQSLGLYLRGLRVEGFPLTNPMEILQVIAWCAVGLNLVIRQVFQLNLLNFFTAGLACILCLGGLAIPAWDVVAPAAAQPGSPWVGFHAALAILSYGVFGILAITSLMYLIQHHGLKSRCSGGFFNLLPAIRQLEDINGRLIPLGVSILTVSVAIGFLNWLHQPAAIGFLKLSSAMIVWLLYIAVLYLRRNQRLMATACAKVCIVFFILALISLWPMLLKPGTSASDQTKIETFIPRL